MEIQLQELIDQIKKDGVDVAEKEATNIIVLAKEQADKIIADAKEQATKLLENAKSEIEKMTKSSEDSIRQAGRNLLISFRESVNRQLQAIVGESVSVVYSSDEFAKIIISAVESWAKKPDVSDIAVILSKDDLEALESVLLKAIKDKMIKGVTLKTSDNLDGGFRIAVNGGGAYYDYSAESVVDMLSNYLSPKVVALLKEAE